MTIDRRSLMLSLAGLGLSTFTASAQRRNVRLVVPFPPGGGIDLIGRVYAQRLSELLEQTWVVENKVGAQSTIGVADVARSAPDGLSFLTNSDIHITSPHVLENLTYDPVADFTPISRFATAPIVLVGNARNTPETFSKLIEAMKAQPDRFTFANAALGAMGHLATESFKLRVGVDTLVVTYRGTAPAITDLISGQTTLMVAPLGSALPYLKNGSLRGFAIMGPERSRYAPDIPTVDEVGLPKFHFRFWYGLWGPKGLPSDIVQRVNSAVQSISKEPGIVGRLAALGVDPLTEDPASFARFIDEEVKRAAEIVKKAKITPK